MPHLPRETREQGQGQPRRAHQQHPRKADTVWLRILSPDIRDPIEPDAACQDHAPTGEGVPVRAVPHEFHHQEWHR